MLRRLFSYEGELGRRGFLFGLLVAWAPLLTLLWAIGTYSHLWDEGQSVAVFTATIMVIVLHLGLVLSLQTRRLRSAGAPAPFLIAAGVFGLSVLDVFLLSRLPGLSPPLPDVGLSLAGWTAQLGLHLVLFLWPPRPARPADVADAFS